ncbi:DUF2335 domain-containing protein [Humibacter ginsenosidimutans]|nr:DUF2335 domain-containing protein [Humibacter ginsenosidimutans]
MSDSAVEPVPPEEPESSADSAPIGPQTEQEAIQSQRIEFHEEYSGQLPHWRHLNEYERIYPGAAKIIFESFEKQGDHRREMEARLLTGSERRASVGQFLGTGLLLVAILGGIYLVIDKQAVAGISIFTLALATGVVSYVFGDRPKK